MNMTTAAIAAAASASCLPGAQGFEMQSFDSSQLSLTCQSCTVSNSCKNQNASTQTGISFSNNRLPAVECSDLKLDAVCQYDKPIETFHECNEHEEKFEDCFESSTASSDVFSTSYCCFKVPCYFPIFEKNKTVESHQDSFVGLEVFETREQRYDVFTAKSKQRFGLMIDTGAPDNCVGEDWLLRLCAAHSICINYTPYQSQLSGVGRGVINCSERAQVPIAFFPGHSGIWDSQALTKDGSRLPPLWGLQSLITHKSIIDLSQDPLTISVLIAPDVRKTLKLEVINGHLICPCDFYGDKPFPALPSKQDFVKDPLGLSTWVVDNDPTDQIEKANTPPLFSAWTYPEVEDNQTCFDDCLSWQWPKECLQEDEQEEHLPVFADVAPPVTGRLAPTSHAFASGGQASAPTETFSVAPVYPLSSLLAARPTFAKDTTTAVCSAKRKNLSSGQNQKSFAQTFCT
jgi:hypothetical protein